MPGPTLVLDTPLVAEPEAKYRAPALEKGLDVLELLAEDNMPLTLAQISARLSRSISEIFRMVQVLEMRGYIASSRRHQGFELTDKCFALGLMQSLFSRLLAEAAPVMKALSETTGQSCNLSVACEDQIVVISHVVPENDLAFTVRTGSRHPIIASAAGAVLYAFSRGRMLTRNSARKAPGETRTAIHVSSPFQDRLVETARLGHCVAPNPRVSAVTDIAVPIKAAYVAIAALTVPYLRSHDALDLALTISAVGRAAADLSKTMTEPNSRRFAHHESTIEHRTLVRRQSSSS